MRVLVVTPWFPSAQIPGSGIFNLRDTELLAQDHQVSVLHLVDPAHQKIPEGELLPSGIRVDRVPFSTSLPRTYSAARRAVAEAMGSAELVHTMAFPALLPVWFARLNRTERVPWVHTEHWSGLVNEHPSFIERVSRGGLGWLLSQPDAVVAVGSGLAETMQKHRKDTVEVIGNRVMLASGNALSAAPRADADPLRLIGVGGLVPWKGPLEAVETVAMLRQLGVSATLRWAGEGPLREAVLQRAAELGIRDRITLLGQRSPEQLPGELAAAHMFLLPTKGETFGVAIAEALSHGLPVVTSGSGGHREFLPEQASRVVEDRTGAVLARALLDLQHDPARWTPDEIADYARRTFSESNRRARYASVYQRAISATSRRS